VRLIYQWYLDGDGQNGPMSMLGIATRLTELGVLTRGDKEKHVAKKRGKGVWASCTVRNILRNETYTGVWHYGKTHMVDDGKAFTRKQKPKCGLGKQMPRSRDDWIPVQVPAIIDRKDFEEAQKRLKMNKEKAKRNVRYQYLMGRRLCCVKCGYSYIGMTRRHKHQYYYCKGKAQKPVSLCDMPNFKANGVNDAMWSWVESILLDPEALAEGLRDAQANERKKNQTLYDGLEIVSTQLEESEQQLARLLDLYISGDFDKEMLVEVKVVLSRQLQNSNKRRSNSKHVLTQPHILMRTLLHLKRFALQ
jgi:site-specific DNA recombinase